ncbi:MAG: glycosyltransferase [Cytophagales bacterium]|nr:MAG: glycosyltransferase [Cytophagales bacterium]
MFFSIIIPVYNRPDEIEELLASLTQQNYPNFEVLVVEDGSQKTCAHVIEAFRETLNIQYYFKPNTGAGDSRNYGFERAKGDFFIVFDSDCLIPPDYLRLVAAALQQENVDAYGGPDAADEHFSPIQKAINYTMTSFLTTGGIRGRKKMLGKYQARSFNMGISRKVYEQIGGFSHLRVSEDIELSIRINKAGFSLVLLPEAYVFHKRRSTFGQFFKQTHNFGGGRAHINRLFPEERKWVHFFPSLFVLFCIAILVSFFIHWVLFALSFTALLGYVLAIFLHSSWLNGSIQVGFLSVFALFVQMMGYGTGFLRKYLFS